MSKKYDPELIRQANRMLAQKWEARAKEWADDGKRAASVAATAKANAHWVESGSGSMESTGHYSNHIIPRNAKYLKKIKNPENLKRIFAQYVSAKNWTNAEKVFNGS